MRDSVDTHGQEGFSKSVSVLINIQDLVKTFGTHSLFDGLSFGVNEGDRIGLIGPNGAGKTTLLEILAGEVVADSGDLTARKGLKVGYLAQIPQLEETATIFENVFSAVRGSADGESIAQEQLAKFSLNGTISGVEPDRIVGELSGGWKKRVAMAKEFAKRPDLLLLDEPTNHLDVETILWLESFLARSDFATITITHDRVFLQKVSNRIVEIDSRHEGGVLSVQGDYGEYLKQRALLLDSQKKQEESLKNRLRRETEWLQRGAKARSTKQKARIQRSEDLKEDVSELRARNQSRVAQFEFQGQSKIPKRLLEAKNISYSVEHQTLFKNVDVFLGPQSRLGLLGHNGCGKSSLIRVLVKELPPDSGEVFHAERIQIAYFEQNRESLVDEETLVQAIAPHGDQVIYRGRPLHVKSYLGKFLFRPEQMDLKVGKLSGGEKSRLLIAKLMLLEANLLILDEPTNDLDIATLDILEECLQDFSGSVILVSHDRYFLDQVAQTILAFDPRPDGSRELTEFTGLHQWENWRKNLSARNKPVQRPSSQSTVSTPSKGKRLGYMEQREWDAMEGNIQGCEAEIESLNAESMSEQNQSDAHRLNEIFASLAKKQAELERLYARWEELEAKKNASD